MFSNVKDSTGVDILSKLDKCLDGNIYSFTLDSLKTTKCNQSNVNHFYITKTNPNGKKFLVSENNEIEITRFDCKSFTFVVIINRPGLFVGTAYYTMIKQ